MGALRVGFLQRGDTLNASAALYIFLPLTLSQSLSVVYLCLMFSVHFSFLIFCVENTNCLINLINI